MTMMINFPEIDWSYRWTRNDDYVLAAMFVTLIAAIVGAACGY